MEFRTCKKINISINGKPVLLCLRKSNDRYLVVPTIREAYQDKYVGIRETIIKYAERIHALIVVRVEKPEAELVLNPVEVRKKSIRKEEESKFGGHYRIFLYNIVEEIRKQKQASLL